MIYLFIKLTFLVNDSSNGDDPYGWFSKYDNVISLSTLKTALPQQMQGEFERLIQAGEISFTCV